MSNNNPSQNVRKSLADLKKQLETAQPVYVDSQGRLTTPEEEAIREKVNGPQTNGTNQPIQVKPSRWF